MYNLFASLKGFAKLPSVVIDNIIFKLHYKVTAPVLIAFSLIVSSYQYIGHPISCISKDDIPENVLNTFCWVHSTFSIESAWLKEVGVEVPYPGVDKSSPEDKKIYHAYYQWVCFMLFFQAILFYAPRYFWKVMESEKMKGLIFELGNPLMEEEVREDAVERLSHYLIRSFSGYSMYFKLFCLAETLNAVNVMCQLFLVDRFLGYLFASYGISVMAFSEWDGSIKFDPMIRVFPRLTKCTFHRFGSSGDVQVHDAMCILPINIINEKIYIFIWFWFAILTFLSLGALIYRIVLCIHPYFRLRALQARTALVPKPYLKKIAWFKSENWFIFYLLAKNLDPVTFRDIVKKFLTSDVDKEQISEDTTAV